MSNTKPFNHTWLLTQGTKSSNKPTISVAALSDIIGSRTVNVEARFVEDITDTLDTLGSKVLTRNKFISVGERTEAVILTPFEIQLDVKVRITVLFVNATTLLDDLFDFGTACCRGVFVRSLAGCCGHLIASFGSKLSVGV